jgi:histidinol dehydrogenase
LKIIRNFDEAKKALARQGPSRRALDADAREQTVRRIIDDVGSRGDAALLEYTKDFDGVKLNTIEVGKKQIAAARKEVASGLISALKLAAGRIEAFHRAQLEVLQKGVSRPGLAQLVRPLERVGVHVPGASAFYPSTMLMTVVPAKVAGVKEVIVVTPPRKDGTVHPVTLAAAGIAGADRIFAVGGAQAVAALAFGTETVPAVDMVCGPGNIYVMLAKRLLYGTVGIDGLYGPSEVMIIADESADPAYCAADLLAQAEHTMAEAVLVTTSPELAEKVVEETEAQLQELSQPELARESLDERGIIAVVKDIGLALELANLYAPEHLLLMGKNAASLVDKINNAGCIVTGEKATVVLGDYVAGPSHSLPTGGTARFGSPLNVGDFLKITSLIDADKLDIAELGKAARTLAEAEGLEAHARAMEKRLK